MRLVFDTNVLISALLSPKSIAAKILNWAENNRTVLYSEATLIELISVLNRPKFSKYISPEDIAGLAIRIKAVWLSVEIINQIKLCRDPKDDKFIDIAINGEASHIITGDNDLLVLHPIETISVINPRSFLDEFLD
jgi:putative PIN family toxin of toxin-antitoxin system